MSGHDYAIRVQNLQKIFKVYASPKQMLKELILGGTRHKEFHALKDISFEVKRGEVVGVMGRNGAGKSTLLRILAGTLNATSGTVNIPGRVSAILELGTGFNPEYTGRENIVSGGLVLGMRKQEIAAKMDEIIAFAELEDFIDQPFRTYSSGMQARLTFATAISVNPDVLIVDEALAVGDARFQAKCYAKIREFQQNDGSIFLVSHAENVITQFCNRVLLLEKGTLLMDAPPREVTMAYCDMVWSNKELSIGGGATQLKLGAISSNTDKSHPITNKTLSQAERNAMKQVALARLGIQQFVPHKNSRRLGTAEMAEILDFAIYNDNDERVTQLQSGHRYSCTTTVLAYENIEEFCYGIVIRSLTGITLFGTGSQLSSQNKINIHSCKRGQVMQLKIDMHINLTNTYFFVTTSFAENSVQSREILDGYYDGLCIKMNQDERVFSDSLIKLEYHFLCNYMT